MRNMLRSVLFRLLPLLLLSRQGWAGCSPEMDPGSTAGGIALLAGAIAMFFGSRKRKQ